MAGGRASAVAPTLKYPNRVRVGPVSVYTQVRHAVLAIFRPVGVNGNESSVCPRLLNFESLPAGLAGTVLG
jgi:hypothetical protein